MSNTSMSLHTQSQVMALDTDRQNILKDSAMTLQEDSTVFNEKEGERVSISKQNNEILNRQVNPLS